MCSNKKCGCGGVTPNIVCAPAVDPLVYRFIGIPPIKVTEKLVGNVVTVTISLVEIKPPAAALSVTPTVAEVGQLVAAVFTASANAGSSPIVTRSITGQAAMTPTQNNFTFDINGLRNSPGELLPHTYTVTDEQKQTASAGASISVQHRFLILFSTNKILTAIELQEAINAGQGVVAPSMKAAYGAMREYPVPGVLGQQKNYIHWLYPEGDPGIGQPVADTGEPVPVDLLPEMLTVTNLHGLALNYVNARTSYAFGPFTFKFTF